MTQMATRRDATPTGDPTPLRHDHIRRNDPVELHREDVVARLLAGGISPATLHRILPEWRGLIDAVAARLEATGTPRA
jgi:hypothetical protein